jgi:hypothetical protein
MDEDSVGPAIQGLEGYQMHSGIKLEVHLPNPRSRSGSYSSQNAYEKNYQSNFTGPRDFQHRGNNRRSSIRNQSISYRAPSYASGMDGHAQASSKPPEGPSPSRTPLTEGFQAQLQPTQQFPMHIAAEPLKSTLAEMLQHNAAMNRYPNQNQLPLRNIEKYPTAHSKENNRVHGRNIFVNLDNAGEQSRMVMSQGSYNRKENSPKKKGSTKNTPFTSPKKGSFCPQGSDNNQKGNGGKKKKGSKQTS